MTKTPTTEDIIEELAQIEHTQWQSWRKHIEKKYGIGKSEWINTEYENLPNEVKNQDRMWVMIVMGVIQKHFIEKSLVKETMIELKAKCQCCEEENHTDAWNNVNLWIRACIDEKMKELGIAEEPVSYFPDTGLNDSPKCSDKSKGEPCEPTEDKEADEKDSIAKGVSDLSASDICVNCGKTIEHHWKSPDKEIICVNAKGLMPTKFSRRRRKENE
jgi:hypothetical protein